MNDTALTLGRARAVVETKNMWRNHQALGFTIFFPVMLLLLFASIFSGTVDGTDVPLSQVYVAGIMGSTLMSTGFVGLAIGMAVERDSGMLKRLAGTPMPKSSYFMGKVGMVFATAGVQIALLLALGVAFFGLDLPSTASRWWTFTWVIVLGITASTLLGIAVGGIVRDAKSAPAVTNLPFIALQFISGVFIAVNLLPLWVVRVSQLFPLHWICRGMRAAFLPDSFSTIETGGSWNLGVAAAVLGAWCIGGFVLCAKTFRWVRD